MKRVITIESIGAVSISTFDKSNEFVVHVPTEYDYRFCTKIRDEIIETLKMIYIQVKNMNLPIYGIPSKKLRSILTTENMMKRGITKFPPSEKFLYECDNVI